MERVRQLGAVAERLERLDRGATRLLGLVVARLLHQRNDEAGVRPAHPAVVAERA